MSMSETNDERSEDSEESADARKLGKRQLRSGCLHIREQLGQAYRDRASELICEHIQKWTPFKSARVVLAYLPMRGEVDVRPLIARISGVRVAIPRVVEAPEPHLAFHAYQLDRLIRHRYGMLEPDPATPVISDDQADLIIVPGLAFTRSGFRLGYGGGFYDRLLARREHALTLGVCFQALVLDEIPHEHHDVPVDNVVTETSGVLVCRAPV
jgi:5-formyltetrahydrofolate cyclo-ligase